MKNKGKKTKGKPGYKEKEGRTDLDKNQETQLEEGIPMRGKISLIDKEKLQNIDTDDASLKLFYSEILNDTENFRITEEEEESPNYYSLGGDNDLINPDEED